MFLWIVSHTRVVFRSFATPPEPVQIVCECVAILKGVKEVNWKSAKGLMADPNFLRTLQEMNCDLITQAQQKAVKAHMKVWLYLFRLAL